MTVEMAVDLFRRTMLVTFWLSLPILTIGFLVGIGISLVQILTSIQDSSFSAAPRLAAFLFGLLVLMPWMMTKLITFATALFSDFSHYAR